MNQRLHHFFQIKTLRRLAIGLATSALVLGTIVSPITARASTPELPAAPSSVGLPTTQIDGIVWSQVLVGNTLYATGRFKYARPAGVALGGPGSVIRTNILAYNITNGVLDKSFVHSLGGTGIVEGRSIAASPDGKHLYIGGTFSKADGQPHSNLVAINLTTNQIQPNFVGTNGRVNAIVATNIQVYVGGLFSMAGGQSHLCIASYSASGKIITKWRTAVNGNVAALVITPKQQNLVIGGSFSKINNSTYYSLGAVKLTTGAAVVPWASRSAKFPIRDQITPPTKGSGAGITSLSTDGTQVYLTSYAYIHVRVKTATFEGRAAIRASDGGLVWLNDCHGDSYDAIPIGGVLYSVSHAHDCRTMGLWGTPNPPRIIHHALAETTHATGLTKAPTESTYPSFAGMPHSAQLDWYPDFTIGKISGQNQAAWSITGNTNYLALGGEFPKVNGIAQQGLVRFALTKP